MASLGVWAFQKWSSPIFLVEVFNCKSFSESSIDGSWWLSFSSSHPVGSTVVKHAKLSGLSSCITGSSRFPLLAWPTQVAGLGVQLAIVHIEFVADLKLGRPDRLRRTGLAVS